VRELAVGVIAATRETRYREARDALEVPWHASPQVTMRSMTTPPG
jgi:hypothetical protein